MPNNRAPLLPVRGNARSLIGETGPGAGAEWLTAEHTKEAPAGFERLRLWYVEGLCVLPTSYHDTTYVCTDESRRPLRSNVDVVEGAYAG